MRSYLTFAAIVAVLAILLWFVLNAFLSTTGSEPLSSGGVDGDDTYTAENFSEEGFAAFEEQKALEELEKKVKEERKKETVEEESAQTQSTGSTNNTQQPSSTITTLNEQELTPLQRLQREQAEVARQRQLLEQELEGKRAPQNTSLEPKAEAAAQTTQSQSEQPEQPEQAEQATSPPAKPVDRAPQTQAAQQPTQTQHSQQTQKALQVLETQLGTQNAPTDQSQPTTTHIRALDAVLSVENSINCQDDSIAGIFFRKNSVSIRGQSLLALDELIRAHKKCLNSVFLLKGATNEESAVMLNQRRRDEVKYYLLQRSVNKSAIRLDQ